MNKTKKILSIIILIIIALGICTSSIAAPRGLFNPSSVGTYQIGDQVSIGYYQYEYESSTVYCAEHGQALKTAPIPYTLVSKVSIAGDKSTDHTGNSITATQNAILAEILTANGSRIDRKNAVWNYLSTWMYSVGMRHSGLSAAFVNGVPGGPSQIYNNAISNAGNNTQQGNGKISDLTDKKKIRTESISVDNITYTKVGPFKWEFSGQLDSIEAYGKEGKDTKTIKNAKYAVYEGKTIKIVEPRDIKSKTDDFYLLCQQKII